MSVCLSVWSSVSLFGDHKIAAHSNGGTWCNWSILSASKEYYTTMSCAALSVVCLEVLTRQVMAWLTCAA